MAIADPFALDVKAFSAEYGEPRHSVNAARGDETRLKDSGQTGLHLGPLERIALPEVSTISSGERL
jgi:hypothetical protein